MKKITTFIMSLLLLMATGATAQVITTWDTAGDPVLFDDFVASAGTGQRYAFRMPSVSLRGWCNFQSKAAAEATNLGVENLFSIVVSPSAGGFYWLKRDTDGKYLAGADGGNGLFEEEGVNLFFDNRTPNFSDPEEQYPVTEMAPYYISMDNSDGLHFNNGNFGFFAGTAGWSAYFAYGPFYIVTVNCVDEGENPISDPVYFVIKDGDAEITAPSILGKNLVGEATVTVEGGADSEVTFVYEDALSFDYDLVITGGVPGMQLYIQGDEVDPSLTTFSAIYGAVHPGDVVVVFPDEYEYMGSKVTVEGATITIKCYDTRYGVNFDLDQTYTRTDRSTTYVALGEQKVEWEFQGAGVEPVYRDMTDQVLSVPAGATVTPSIGYNGSWMHGFFYIDLDNDGQYTVNDPDVITPWSDGPNGELVSYKNEGNVLTSSARDLPDFTAPSEPGTYRVRFKVDWASTDPGGNPGADPDDVTSSQHIVANGGCIIDVMMVVGEGHTVTYQVVEDGTGKVLASKTSEVAAGATISKIPSELLLPAFYDYSEVTPVTVTSDVTITTTATIKENPLIRFTSDTTDPVWYTLILKESYYPTYDPEADPEYEPNVALPQENADNDNTSWAFIGTPYGGFQIINKAAGTDLVLGSPNIFDEDEIDDGAAGGNTAATMAAPGTQPNELWFPKTSTYIEGGFFLYSKEGYALNQRSTWDLAYWTGGADRGSTFIVKEVLSNDERLAEAKQLLEELTAGANDVKVGYPNTGALARFEEELKAIEDLMSTLSDEDFKAMLNAAIEEVTNPANVEYTPRTDVYYTITNTRGSIVYNPEHDEDFDGAERNFVWYTTELDKDDPNHQWGFYEKDGELYLYNVGKQLFANVSTSNPEISGKLFFADGCWVFDKTPAAMNVNAGDDDWVTAPEPGRGNASPRSACVSCFNE